jgi:hypothetical protein
MAWWLGYGGLLPFFILSIALLLNLPLPFLDNVRLDWWLAAYAASILSFLGAVHWGVVLGMQANLSEMQSRNLLIYSVIPSVLAWFALLLPIQAALIAMAVLMILAYAMDSLLLLPLLHPTYATLRIRLTVVASLLLFAAASGGLA